MSLAEIEDKVLALSEAERRRFADWFFQNQGRILPPPLAEEDDEDTTDIAPEVMEELLRRRQEIEDGTVKLCTVEEMSSRVQEALDEVHRSRH